jgi:hypothetical protein
VINQIWLKVLVAKSSMLPFVLMCTIAWIRKTAANDIRRIRMANLGEINGKRFIASCFLAIVDLYLIHPKKVNNMEAEVHKVPLHEIQDLRNLSLLENAFQFVHDKCHGAGWADTYIFSIGKEAVGYGSVWGKDDRKARDTIFEFYLLRSHRKFANIIFPKFKIISEADFMECQTNNNLQSQVMFEYTRNIYAEAILFEDSFQTELSIPDTLFKNNSSDKEGPEYVLVHTGQIVASGGYVRNYNYPYIDMYYEVKEDQRKKGFGSLFTQELKREAYRLKRVPSARCNIKNNASKATLLRAGMKVCGHMLIGEL